MVRETGIPVGLLPVAHGGTSLDQWNPALKEEGRLSLYGFMREQLRSAGGRVCGLLWYQGESDAWDAGTTATYAERFQAFVKNVREDFGWFQAYGLEMPVLWVQLGRLITPIEWGAGPNAWNQIQETQRTLVDSIPNSAMVPAVDLELDDAIHIGRYGLKRLGRRLARVALALLEGHTELPGPRLVQVAVEGENRRCIRVSYSGVADYSFETNHRISGFSVHNRQGEPLEFIYKAEVDVEQPSDILLWLVEPVEPGMTLRYGAGFNPVCTLTDKDDMALPVSGPHEL
jgi:sialate O-acetylesterase